MRDLLQNVVDCFGPHERFGVLVIEPNELVARRDQLRHAREDAARMRVRVISPTHRSTRFSHEGLVGIRCR